MSDRTETEIARRLKIPYPNSGSNISTSMKFVLLTLLAFFCPPVFGDTPDIAIPEHYAELIKTADCVEVSGTNDKGKPEDFTIHNFKAISQFVQLLTSDRYTAVPKDLKPKFKSLSFYKVRLSAKGAPVLELRVIADSVLDMPNETSLYMQSERHSDNLMAPLLRLR
jgi:hypothetical protein